MFNKQYYVYIITNIHNNVFYCGVSSDIIKRIYQHKNKLLEGFSSQYNLTKLVYYEIFDNPENAIIKEKQIKKWNK
jgi:putative endonuclease